MVDGPKAFVFSRALMACTVAAVLLQPSPAAAQPGTKVSEIFPVDSLFGVSVAFDGQFLYYTNFNDVILHRIAPDGVSGHVDVPIVGAPGINAFSYDATRDKFWAAASDGLSIYLLEKSGMATLQFVLNPILDLPGNCDSPFGCLSLIDGLAYDAVDDSLWYSPDASQRVYHYNTVGDLLGFFDVNDPPNDMPECQPFPGNYSSGIAAGADDLYLQADGCDTYFRYSKVGVKLDAFPYDGLRAEDSECDDLTFDVDVIWVRDVEGRLAAFEQPVGRCLFGGGVPPQVDKGRMTGGGNFIADFPTGATVHHGFMLHCNKDVKPNRLQVNWQSGDSNNRFHLESLETATCTNDPAITPDPPGADFDTHEGTGTGRYNGVSGATIEWKFKDGGEPSAMDSGCIRITAGSPAVTVLEVGVCPLVTSPLITGNHQAHNSKK